MTLTERFEAARKRENGKIGSRGLPQGATKFVDSEVDTILQNSWIEQIRFYKETGQTLANWDLLTGLMDYETELSGPDSKTFNNQTHPQVEGYEWDRGIIIGVKRLLLPLVGKPQIIIFTGNMRPLERGGAPDPLVYFRGGVQTKDVLDIVQKYTAGISARIEALSH